MTFSTNSHLPQERPAEEIRLAPRQLYPEGGISILSSLRRQFTSSNILSFNKRTASANISVSSPKVKWSIPGLTQLLAFSLLFGYGAVAVATSATRTLSQHTTTLNICVVTFGACAVARELEIWIGLFCFVLGLPKMRVS
jgi:hypothetical protein